MKGNIVTNLKWQLFASFAFVLVPKVAAQMDYALLSSTEVREAAIPFYVGQEQKPSMVLRVGRIYTDYESMGFFRIGLLPLEVLEGVTIEMCHQNQMTNSLAKLNGWISPQAAKRVEFREVKFLAVTQTGTNRLDCGRMRILPGENWELLDGVRFSFGTNLLTAVCATLQVSGEKAGQLVIAAGSACTNNLFICSAVPTLKHPENP